MKPVRESKPSAGAQQGRTQPASEQPRAEPSIFGARPSSRQGIARLPAARPCTEAPSGGRGKRLDLGIPTPRAPNPKPGQSVCLLSRLAVWQQTARSMLLGGVDPCRPMPAPHHETPLYALSACFIIQHPPYSGSKLPEPTSFLPTGGGQDSEQGALRLAEGRRSRGAARRGACARTRAAVRVFCPTGPIAEALAQEGFEGLEVVGATPRMMAPGREVI